MHVLSCEDLSLIPRIHHISCHLSQGEMVALIGPNGAGKSTLLKLIAGVIQPTSGAISIAGENGRKLTAKKRAQILGYLPQQTVIDVGYSVADVVAMGFYARLRHGFADELDAILEKTGLGSLRDRDIRSLSGGERQRVLLGKVLAQDAPLLLLDEPVTGLDVRYQVELLELSKALVAEGKTILVTLHDLEQVVRYANRVMVIHEGLLVAQGDPLQVLTDQLMEKVFGVRVSSFPDPVTGHPRLSMVSMSV
ncbi:MAG: ABC transporter ATP-binding protein [Acidibacillus sp.]|nr:ABC transporter ATP-binding protein [Acidibacillus sp.]